MKAKDKEMILKFLNDCKQVMNANGTYAMNLSAFRKCTLMTDIDDMIL